MKKLIQVIVVAVMLFTATPLFADKFYSNLWPAVSGLDLGTDANGFDVIYVDKLGGDLDGQSYDIVDVNNITVLDDIMAGDSFFASFGAVDSPSHSFTNDIDTGMFRRSIANQLGFAAGGELRLILAGGYVVILAKLTTDGYDIENTGHIDPKVAGKDIGAGTPYRNLFLSGNAQVDGNLTDGTNSLSVAEANDAYTHIDSNGTDHSFIDQNVATTASPTFANLTTTDDIIVGRNLYVVTGIIHSGDPDTSLTFGADSMLFDAGGVRMMSFVESAKSIVTVNPNGADIDFRVEGVGQGNAIFVRGSDGYVGIGTNTPETELQVVGGATIGDDTNDLVVSSTGGTYWTGASSGLPYGCIISDTGTDVILAAQDTWYQIVAFDTDKAENILDADHTNDHITITKTGVYYIGLTACAHSAASNDYQLRVKKNNGATDLHPHLYQTTAVAGQIENIAGTCIESLTVDDTLEVWILRTDGGAVEKTLTTDHIALNVTMLGG